MVWNRTGSGNMGLVRLFLLCFCVYVVVTAPAEEQARMFSGAHAFARSAITACTSQSRPCTTLISKLSSIQFAEQPVPTKQAQPVDTAPDARRAYAARGF
jgi:hypothetical protein